MDLYKEITNKIIEQLEQGTVPWKRPWKAGFPANLVTKKPYRGVNVFLLSIVSDAQGFSSPLWATFNQIRAKGGRVKKGEKGTVVIFWKLFKNTEKTVDQETGEEIEKEKVKPLLRYYTVFNLDQTEGIELTQGFADKENDPIKECEKIVKGMPKKPKISHGGTRACYSPKDDAVKLPPMKKFDSSEEYYSTLFHELTHSTGHKDRLNRKELVEYQGFGSQDYSKEELVAEMGAAFLCGAAGTVLEKTLENSAAYVQNWLKVLKEDNKMVVYAAASAQKATDFILNKKFTNKTEGKKKPPRKPPKKKTSV